MNEGKLTCGDCEYFHKMSEESWGWCKTEDESLGDAVAVESFFRECPARTNEKKLLKALEEAGEVLDCFASHAVIRGMGAAIRDYSRQNNIPNPYDLRAQIKDKIQTLLKGETK